MFCLRICSCGRKPDRNKRNQSPPTSPHASSSLEPPRASLPLQSTPTEPSLPIAPPDHSDEQIVIGSSSSSPSPRRPPPIETTEVPQESHRHSSLSPEEIMAMYHIPDVNEFTPSPRTFEDIEFYESKIFRFDKSLIEVSAPPQSSQELQVSSSSTPIRTKPPPEENEQRESTQDPPEPNPRLETTEEDQNQKQSAPSFIRLLLDFPNNSESEESFEGPPWIRVELITREAADHSDTLLHDCRLGRPKRRVARPASRKPTEIADLDKLSPSPFLEDAVSAVVQEHKVEPPSSFAKKPAGLGFGMPMMVSDELRTKISKRSTQD